MSHETDGFGTPSTLQLTTTFVPTMVVRLSPILIRTSFSPSVASMVSVPKKIRGFKPAVKFKISHKKVVEEESLNDLKNGRERNFTNARHS